MYLFIVALGLDWQREVPSWGPRSLSYVKPIVSGRVKTSLLER